MGVCGGHWGVGCGGMGVYKQGVRIVSGQVNTLVFLQGNVDYKTAFKQQN